MYTTNSWKGLRIYVYQRYLRVEMETITNNLI